MKEKESLLLSNFEIQFHHILRLRNNPLRLESHHSGPVVPLSHFLFHEDTVGATGSGLISSRVPAIVTLSLF